MNGTMARLLGAVAVASTLILGGCIAETGEEQETAAAPVAAPRTSAVLKPAAVTSQPAGVVRSADSQSTDFEQGSVPNNLDALSNDPGNDGANTDPEPAPWLPIGPPPHTPR